MHLLGRGGGGRWGGLYGYGYYYRVWNELAMIYWFTGGTNPFFQPLPPFWSPFGMLLWSSRSQRRLHRRGRPFTLASNAAATSGSTSGDAGVQGGEEGMAAWASEDWRNDRPDIATTAQVTASASVLSSGGGGDGGG